MVRRRPLVVAVALTLVAGLSGPAVLGTTTWKRLHRTPLEEALASVPAGFLRVGYDGPLPFATC